MKTYKAIIWNKDPQIIWNKEWRVKFCAENRDDADKQLEAEYGVRRVSVLAEDLDDAKKRLEAEYGVGNVFSLYNEEEASRIR